MGRMLVCTRYEIFFFNDTATNEIYTLSLHDALPILVDHMISAGEIAQLTCGGENAVVARPSRLVAVSQDTAARSEEHTSELQSRQYLVCRLLLEKKTNTTTPIPSTTSRS